MTSKTIAIHTMGCRANQYDSGVMEGFLSKSGWKLVPFNKNADAYLLNTCTVTNQADAEARQMIRRAHRRNPEASILVTGCYAQTQPLEVASIEGVSFVLGNNQKGKILSCLEQARPLVPEVIVEDLFQEELIFTSDFSVDSKHSRAYLKIQDGCNQMCSYCVIPFARGINRSLSPEKVISELKRLSSEGFYEAVLTGIHIGTYGRDLPSPTTLLDLMRKIEEEMPIYRVRLSSIDPEEVDEEMVSFLSKSKVFCEYLHIPLQSGDDQILKLMRRRYTADQFRHLTERLKERIPNICIGTDLMVGFPYEDEERYRSSRQLIESVPVDYLHVFPYASKKKTRAARFLGQISNQVKRERVHEMTLISKKKKELFYIKELKSEAEVVVEEKKENGERRGISRNYLPVYFCPKDDPSFSAKKIVNLKVSHFEGGKLFGEVVSRGKEST